MFSVFIGRHGGALVSTVTLQHEGLGKDYIGLGSCILNG